MIRQNQSEVDMNVPTHFDGISDVIPIIPTQPETQLNFDMNDDFGQFDDYYPNDVNY
jgi:hypothetical protein